VQANQPAQAVQLLLQNRHMLDQLSAKREAEEEEEDGGGMLDRLCQALDRHELFDKVGGAGRQAGRHMGFLQDSGVREMSSFRLFSKYFVQLRGFL